MDLTTNIKKQYAKIIDGLQDLYLRAQDVETKRMLAIAISDAQTSEMWAVKAVTLPY
jgi:ribosomal protein RSM22 (predicted rRNA methylase)